MNFGLLKNLLLRESPGALLSIIFHPKSSLHEVARLKDVEENPEHHPEGRTGIHMSLVMERVYQLSEDPKVRLAALLHDVGKAITGGLVPHPQTGVVSSLGGGRHTEHDSLGAEIIHEMFSRYTWPHSWRGLSKEVAELHIRSHMLIKDGKPADPRVWVKFIEDLKDSWVTRGVPESQWRENLEGFGIACQSDAQGRLGREKAPYPQAQMLLDVFDEVQKFQLPSEIQRREKIRVERDQTRGELLEVMRSKLKACNPDVSENEIQAATSKQMQINHSDLIIPDLLKSLREQFKKKQEEPSFESGPSC